MHDHLSAPWFDACLTRAAGRRFGRATLAVQWVATDGAEHRPSHQRFDDGHLVEWGAGWLPDAPVALVQRVDDARRAALGLLRGNAAVARTVLRRPDGSGPLPPSDLCALAPFGGMPVIPGASITAQHVLVDGPFGTVTFVEGFVDGRRTSWDLGRDPEADVTLVRRYGCAMERRAGLRSNVASFEGGRVGGPWTMVMMLAGLTDGPEYRAASSLEPTTASLLAGLSEVMADESYRELQVELRACTRR